jgi:hypothetical protein
MGYTLVVDPNIGNVLHEQHHQDVVLVLGWVDSAAKGITRPPEDGVDFVLIDDGHGRPASTNRYLGILAQIVCWTCPVADPSGRQLDMEDDAQGSTVI